MIPKGYQATQYVIIWNEFVHLRHAPWTIQRTLTNCLWRECWNPFIIWVLAYLRYVLRDLIEISESIIVCRGRASWWDDNLITYLPWLNSRPQYWLFPRFFWVPPPSQWIPMTFTDYWIYVYLDLPNMQNLILFTRKKPNQKAEMLWHVYIYLEDPGIPKNHMISSQSAPLKSELIGVFCFYRIALREWASRTPPRNEDESDFQFLDYS